MSRVQESSRTLRGLGGDVVERIYPGFGHSINADELYHVRGILGGLLQSTSASAADRL
jgi:predicted esterase